MNSVRRTSNRGYVATVNFTRHAGLYPRRMCRTSSAHCPFQTHRRLVYTFGALSIMSALYTCNIAFVFSLRERDKSKALNSEHLAHVYYQKPRTIKQQPKRSGVFARFKSMHRITTFRSTTDRIYDGGPIILYYNNIIL